MGIIKHFPGSSLMDYIQHYICSSTPMSTDPTIGYTLATQSNKVLVSPTNSKVGIATGNMDIRHRDNTAKMVALSGIIMKVLLLEFRLLALPQFHLFVHLLQLIEVPLGLVQALHHFLVFHLGLEDCQQLLGSFELALIVRESFRVGSILIGQGLLGIEWTEL